MVKNAILGEGGEPATAARPADEGAATASVAARMARRAVARREASYADEVRRLLEAGLEVMRRSGTTTSPRVADIVRQAGLSNDAFYRHFAGKEELVAAIVDAGAERLVGYLAHQMGKEATPEAQIGCWIGGIMAQAADPDLAEPTRAVLWNGGRAGDAARRDDRSTFGPLARLLDAPLTGLGRPDPDRDAGVIVQAVMGRMQDFLWRRVQPGPADVAHLITFCLTGLGVGTPRGPAAPP